MSYKEKIKNDKCHSSLRTIKYFMIINIVQFKKKTIFLKSCGFSYSALSFHSQNGYNYFSTLVVWCLSTFCI